jgi:hypothetical protein
MVMIFSKAANQAKNVTLKGNLIAPNTPSGEKITIMGGNDIIK